MGSWVSLFAIRYCDFMHRSTICRLAASRCIDVEHVWSRLWSMSRFDSFYTSLWPCFQLKFIRSRSKLPWIILIFSIYLSLRWHLDVYCQQYNRVTFGHSYQLQRRRNQKIGKTWWRTLNAWLCQVSLIGIARNFMHTFRPPIRIRPSLPICWAVRSLASVSVGWAMQPLKVL